MMRQWHCCLFFLCSMAGAQAADVASVTTEATGVQLRLETTLSPASIRMGGTAVLKLELRYRRDHGEIGPQLGEPATPLEGVEERRRWTTTGSYREGDSAWSVREFCFELRGIREGTAKIPAFPITYLDTAGPATIHSDARTLTVSAPLPARRFPWEWAVGGILAVGFLAIVAMLVRGRRLAREAGQSDQSEAISEQDELRRVRQLRLSGEAAAFFVAAEKLARAHLHRVHGGAAENDHLDARQREAVQELFAACGEAKYNPSARGRDLMENVERRLELILTIPAPTTPAGSNGKEKNKENAR